jgi:hypothetical protein
MLALFLLACSCPPPSDWQVLAPGLELATLDLPQRSTHGDSRLTVARIDPTRLDIALRMESRDGPGRTLAQWAETIPPDKAVVAINASMFQEDYRTSVGLLIDNDHVNHEGLAAEHNSLLAAKPHDPADRPVWLANLGCDPVDEVRAKYALLVQSIRMLGCDGENVWTQQPDKRWSASIIGQDGAGRLLLMHVRSPYTMHDLVEMLRGVPLDLVALHYGDGGPPAGLFVRAPGTVVERLGSFETGIQEDDANTSAWALPNVLLAVSR